jgi:putative oxidoreductase
MEHGFAKLARGLDAFPAILQAPPHLMGWLTILVEIFGGLAVLLGALVPLASIPMAAVLLVATFTVHLPYGFSSIKLQAVTAAGAQFGPPGFETDLLYLACLAALVLAGSGPLAIDSLLAKRREHMCPSSRAEPSAGCRGATGTDEATALSGRRAVCTENLVRVDLMRESLNVSHDGRADILFVNLAVCTENCIHI